MLPNYFPPGWKPTDSPIVERLYSFILGDAIKRPVRRFNLLYGNIDRLARTANLDDALETFESDLHLYVAEMARRRVFVHAGVVGWKGQAILVPGRSYSGKTRLVAELVRAGAIFYSDEYAVLDGRGRVHPYTRALQIREDENGKQKKYPVDELGGQAGVKPLPVKLIMVSKYKRGAKWRPRALSTGQGVLELLNNTVSARRQPETAMAVLQETAKRALVLKGLRGEAREITEPLLAYLDQ